jgi:hypothetical protein
MGYYFSCDYRAALDRAVHEGIADEAATKLFTGKQGSSSPNADLGTCIHFTMQDGMGCSFGKADAEPTPAQWANASQLFGFDLNLTKQAAFKAATLAASHLPKTHDGKPWRAEVRASNRFTQGTIDFLSEDGSQLWDLKTTSKPVLGGHIKAPHLYQLITYRWLLKSRYGKMPTHGGVLYVDALNAKWALPISLDFTTPAFQELTEHVEGYTKFLRSNRLYQTAVPRMGPHCGDDWCPYTSICKQKFLQAPAQGFSSSKPLPTSTAPTLDALSKV